MSNPETKPRCGLSDCDCDYTISELLKALKAAGELWSWLPFDSGDDIQRVANRVAKLQRDAIEEAKK